MVTKRVVLAITSSFVLVALVGGLLLWVLPAWLTLHPQVDGAERHKAIADTRIGIIAFATAAGALAGLAYTIRTYELSRRGQTAERYGKAVEHLGNEDGSIRIGGIYSLAQIAEDDRGARRPVIDILSEFVRVRAPWPADLPSPAKRSPFIRLKRKPARSTEASSISVDAYVAVSMIRKLMSRRGETRLDLRNTNLSQSHLEDMNLVDARLTDANLSGAVLNGADLSGADLRGSVLDDIRLYHANLTDVSLFRGQITTEQLEAGGAIGVSSLQWFDPPTTNPGSS